MKIRHAIPLALLILLAGWGAQAGWFGIDEPARINGALGGLALAIFSNAIPKNLPPLREGRDPDRTQNMQRLAAWTFVATGLASAGIWLLAPIEWANIAGTATIAAGLVAVIGVCFATRLARKSVPPSIG